MSHLRNKGLHSALALAGTLWCSGLAQAQYAIDSWTTDRGLPQNSVLSIQQTPDGYLWFTTFDGLVRFDGVHFTVFNKGNSPGLTSNRFVRLVCARDGVLWAATEDGGLVRYRDGRFRAWMTADGLPSNSVLDIQEDIDGSIWIQTLGAISHLTAGDRIVTGPPQSWASYKTYISPEGSRWEASDGGLLLNRNGRVTRYPLPFDTHSAAHTRRSFILGDVRMEESGGGLWMAAGGRLYRLENGVVTATYGPAEGFPHGFIRNLAHDRDGSLWIASVEEGVCRLTGDRFTCFKASSGLSSDFCASIFADREGAIWVGTNGRGLNRLTRVAVTSLSAGAGLPDRNVYPILVDRTGDIWAGTISGLAQIRGGRVIRFFQRSDGLPFADVEGLFEDRSGRLWIGGDSGVAYYVNGKFNDFTPSLQPGAKVAYRFIYQDAKGAMWFGTDTGLARYQDGKVRRYTTADGLPSMDVKTVLEARDGSLWVGTYGGLARLEGDRFKAFTESQGLAGNHVRALYEDDEGTLWIGTYDSGLSRLRKGAFTNYTTATGLFSNGVFKILEDAHKNFWMSSNQGIYRVSRRELEEVAAGKISSVTSTSFGKSDGMLNAECNGGRQQAGDKMHDGKLLFPTQDGVVVIDPEAVPRNPLPPPVVIESAKVELQPAPLAGGLRLEPNRGNIEIRYTGLSLVKPEQVRFRYRLEGLDPHWVEAGTQRAAVYPYLPPGSYTFHVIAANSDLVWNQQGATLAIVVLPPFYRTWPFIALVCLLAAGTAASMWRRRVMQLERVNSLQRAFSRQLIDSQEQERKRMAGELHDSLGQYLLVIKNRAALGDRVAENSAQSKQQFDEITESATQAIDEVRRIAYNLRPLNLERLGVTAVIEELIENTSASSGIRFFADIEPFDAALSAEGAINLYRIVQESVNNIVRHAGASKTSIEILRDGADIRVTISDNGHGFDIEASARRGLGLTGISERVRMLNGSHTLVSAPGKGTTLTIRIPAQSIAKGMGDGR